MKSSTCASRSQPSGNTNKNKISRTTSSNKKNKVEDHPRSVNSSFNKINRVSKPVCKENVKHFVLNTNSELMFATCNECMFDAIHDLCVHDNVNDVNVRSKSKSSKGSKKKTTWKPTGKVFTNVWGKARNTPTNPKLRTPFKKALFAAYGLLRTNEDSKSQWTEIHIGYCEDLGKLKPKEDIGIFVGYAPAKKAYRIYNKRTHLIIETIHVDFDELTSMFNPPHSVAFPVPVVVAPEPADPTSTPSSTSIDQDAPSLNSDPFFGVPILKPNSIESYLGDVIPTNVNSVNQPPEHLSK
ncbi:hypothetical protein Tco_1229695 [Tanacetum coccineum]